MAISGSAPRWTSRVLGSPVAMPVEHRVFNAFLILLIGTLAAAGTQDVVARLPILVTINSFLGLVVVLAVFVLSRFFGIWRPAVAPVFLLGLYAIGTGWITQAGLLGSAPAFFFLLIGLGVVLFRGRRKAAAVLLAGTTLASLVLLQRFRPRLIRPYATADQQFWDMAFSFALCLLVTTVMVQVIYRGYRAERERNEKIRAALLREKEALARAVTVKHSMLSMVCHDIGNAIMILEHALPGDGTAPRDRDLDRIAFATGNIRTIVSTVRMLEALEQNRLPLHPCPVDLGPVLDQVADLLRERLEVQGVRLALPASSTLPGPVLADATILANHVLTNLVSNAIKFSDPGTTVALEVADMGPEVRIDIRDQGIGIPADMLEHLFLPGHPITRPGTRGEKGTGLGLLTVQSFTERFGGRLTLASRTREASPDAHGTTVSLYLPKPPSAQEGTLDNPPDPR
jgi:signal transduction histidine kinase